MPTEGLLPEGKKIITHLYQAADGNIWAAAFDRPGFCIDFTSSDVRQYSSRPLRQATGLDPAIMTLCRDDDEMDTLIYWIGRAQESDGYLMTARTAGEPGRLHSWLGAERWVKDPDLSHELYNAGHLYEAAAAHYISTGKRTLLDVALKNADLLVKDFLVGQLPYEPGHQIVEMGLVKLYRITGRQDYLKLAKYFLDLRGVRGQGRKEYSQSNKPVIAQTEAVGHAVRAGYMYSGMADVAAIMGTESYRHAIDALWDNVASKKLYINGGIGALHNGEAFGANYELPNATAYCETCAAISNVYWNHRMFLLSGDSKYYDVLERSLYNGVISGIGLDGKTFFYPNPLASTGGYARSEWFGCACCPSNLCRFIPSVPGYAYAHKGDDVYVNLYMQNSASIPVGGGEDSVTVSQTTQYPWDGHVTVRVDKVQKTDRFRMLLRLPGWAKNQPVPTDLYVYDQAQDHTVDLYVNGQRVDYTLEKGYMAVARKWNEGDSITFTLPMDVHRVVANEQVAADKERVALERGPLLYCLEWPDNANQVESCILPDTAAVTTVWQDILGGVNTLQMKGLKASYGKDGLKQSLRATLTAIPYYAWDNRGTAGQMEVWIPRTESQATTSTADIPADTLDFTARMEANHSNPTGTFASVKVTLNKESIARLLGVSATDLSGLIGKDVVYSAINPDGSVNLTSTAKAPGHWFDAEGYATTYSSATSRVFSELDTNAFTFSVGQYPQRCADGTSYIIRQALTYLPADSSRPAKRVVIRIRLEVGAQATAIGGLKGAADCRAATAAYDLAGRRVSGATCKGILITGGKKTLR